MSGAHAAPPFPLLLGSAGCCRPCRQLCLWKQLPPKVRTPCLTAARPCNPWHAEALPSLGDIAQGASDAASAVVDAASSAVAAAADAVDGALSAADEAGSRAWDSVVDLIDSKNDTERLWDAVQAAADAGALDISELQGEGGRVRGAAGRRELQGKGRGRCRCTRGLCTRSGSG